VARSADRRYVSSLFSVGIDGHMEEIDV
jgi:hypothetical protein